MAEIIEVTTPSIYQTVTIGGHVHVIGEVPTGTLNGSNAIFTSAYTFVPESFELFINGVRQKIVEDYNTSGGTTITLTASPASTEHLLINYIKA